MRPYLFKLFVNNLAVTITAAQKGILIENEQISILIYADDIVLIAVNEDNLQFILTLLSDWCG